MEEEVKHNPQKVKWSKVSIYDTFSMADEKRNTLNSKGSMTKIRRCGTEGSRFKVLTGMSIDKPKTNKKKK